MAVEIEKIVTEVSEVEVPNEIAAEVHEILSKRTYVLYYRRSSAAPAEKIFAFNGPLKDATERGRTHCRRMNYNFIIVRPFIVDLDIQEKDKELEF